MIALIDYDAGNTCSVINALERLGIEFLLTDDADSITGADKVIFPGVGHAAAAMQALRRKKLIDVIKGLTQPVLGICVGMQLLMSSSEEGRTECLDIIPGEVVKFDVASGVKVPHMGWNQLHHDEHVSLFDGIAQDAHFYFVHSFYVPANDHSIAHCTYGQTFSAAVTKDNFTGIQFHAEKSGALGSTLLSNFCNRTKS